MATKPGSAVEREHQRAYTNQDQEYCQGWQTWECDRGDEDDLETYLWATSWTVNGHVMVTKSVTVLPQAEEGLAVVRAQYGTFYNPATHPVGVATVTVRTSSTRVAIAAVPVQGTDDWPSGEPRMLPTEPGDGDWTFYDWATKSAPPRTLVHGSVVTVRTAYYRSGVNWNMIFNAHDKVNAYLLPNLGNAAAGTMKLIGAAVPVYYLLGSSYDIVPINYLMKYNEHGWPTSKTYAQKYVRFVRGVPLWVDADNDGDPLGGYYDIYGEVTQDRDEARKVPVTVNRAVGDPIECRSGLTPDFVTFQHLMGLLTWL